MSMTNAAEADLLDLIFLNVDFAHIGNTGGLRGSTAAGSFYISLHTADPGESGNQNTNEASYTGYARVAVARSGSGFTLTTSTISNTALVQFAQCTGGSNTLTHFGIGTDLAGSGNLIFKGALTSSLSVSNGIQPQFAAGALTVTVD
jgi:hypothetical protein